LSRLRETPSCFSTLSFLSLLAGCGCWTSLCYPATATINPRCRVLVCFTHCFGVPLQVCLRSAELLRDEEKMITLRAIKGTAPSECRYHRIGESYDFCTWATEKGGENLRKAPSWLQADAMRFGPIRKTDCETCPAFVPMSTEADET